MIIGFSRAASAGAFNPTLRSTLEDTSNGTSYAASAFTPPANSLLVAFVAATNSLTAGSMSGGGLTWNQELSGTFGSGSAHTLHLFTAAVGGSPASTTPTFDCAADAATACLMAVYSVENYASIDESNSDFDAGPGDPAVTFASSDAADCMLIGFASEGSDPTGQGAPSGWTGYNELNQITPQCAMGTAYKATGETATTIAFVGTDQSSWVALGIQITPA